MDLRSIILIIFYSIPTISAFTSFMLLLVTYQERETVVYGNLRTVSLLFYGISVVTTFGIMIFPYSPEVFAFITPFHYGAILAVPILLYHLIWILTPKMGSDNKFSSVHYLLPVLACIVLLVWSFFIPYNVRVEIAQSRTEIVPGYEVYSSISHFRMEARLLVNIVYLVLTLLRIYNYSKTSNQQQKEIIGIKTWIRLLVSLSTVTLIIAAIGAYKATPNLVYVILSILIGVLLSVLHIELVFRLIKGLFPSATKKIYTHKPVYKKEEVLEGKELNKRFFQQWIKKHKPYLDPSFSLTELSEKLEINRTYISNFVNKTYGMNFSHYLNVCRLKELERLMRLPSNKDKTAIDLIQKAGFGSYRNYLRIKSMEENPKKE